MAYQAQARPKRKPVSNPLQTATRKTNAKGQTRCHTRSSASLGEHEPGPQLQYRLGTTQDTLEERHGKHMENMNHMVPATTKVDMEVLHLAFQSGRNPIVDIHPFGTVWGVYHRKRGPIGRASDAGAIVPVRILFAVRNLFQSLAAIDSFRDWRERSVALG
nr:hypothetical protein Iba_chr11dCG11970 [Ipomoea batatas]